MQKFVLSLIRFSLLPLITLLLLLSTYLYYDPFKVVNKYKSFFVSGQPRYVTPNYDYVAIETFLSNYPIYKYNSFILGNSRSRFYEMSTWSKYIHSDKCFHLDASLETLYGISKKIEFLDARNVQIANILITLDYTTLEGVKNSDGHLFIKHPLLSGQSMRDFQLEFFKAYCSFSFFRAYLDFKISGKIKEYMIATFLFEDTPVDYNTKYNEMRLDVFENLINANPSKYYHEKRMVQFFQRDSIQKYAPEVIKGEQIVMLNHIFNIFKKHATHFKLVINPLYDQLKLNKKDIDILNKIFGTENVYDFSGINSITSDYHNYYDWSHYRPFVADEIMATIYHNEQDTVSKK